MARQVKNASKVQGEGDYESARRFDREEEKFVKDGKVQQKAREAARALNGPEAQTLERARVSSAKGRTDRQT
jgi:hypothetical protein